MSSNDVSETRPRVLFVYYSHTEQARRVCDAMVEVLRGRGCDVSQAAIEFTDPHYAKNFREFPFRHAVFGILPLLWPQLRHKLDRSGSLTRRRPGPTSWCAWVRRPGSSPRTCRCAHI